MSKSLWKALKKGRKGLRQPTSTLEVSSLVEHAKNYGLRLSDMVQESVWADEQLTDRWVVALRDDSPPVGH